MTEVVVDTGPVLHLHQISELSALGIFARLEIPTRVVEELGYYGLNVQVLSDAGQLPEVLIQNVETSDWREVQKQSVRPIHPADAQVAVLARRAGYLKATLTDDLALRQWIEAEGGIAVGSFGILIRRYHLGRTTHSDLQNAVDRLMTESTLYMGQAFREYAQRLIRDIGSK